MKAFLLMFALGHQIIITNPGKYVTTFTSDAGAQIANCRIVEGVKELTNTAVIELPKNIAFTGGNAQRLVDVIQKGNQVVIRLCYNGQYVTEFEGYVSRIEEDIPIRIYCEDEMYNLKKLMLQPQQFTTASLVDLVNYAVGGQGYTLDIVDSPIGNFAVQGSNISAAKMLQFLKDNYGFSANFLDLQTLRAGFPYDFAPTNTVYAIDFQKNLDKGNTNLKYISGEDYPLQVVVKSPRRGKAPVTVTYNPQNISAATGGETRTYTVNSGMSQEDMLTTAQRFYQLIMVQGYSGKVGTFGQPKINVGDAIALVDNNYPDRYGQYFVDNREVEFGTQVRGYRQGITIGKMITING